ncbi:MAG: DNA polymerase III subunit beta [Campylobacterales bacterium]|jgi:DNA polymerase-3 subunit beta|nr:DNA polymerase III subunit beta [Campylobacterales bacterium]NLM98822.1 DNA polymerase III subunit beta [Campylobacteraceae bacterium]
MKVNISKTVLETILLNAQPFLEKKDLSQITSHILIEAKDSSFEVKASDYEIGLTFQSNLIRIQDEGSATANGKKLLDIIKSLKDEEVILETIRDNLYIKQRNSKFKLPMFNPEEFPEFPTILEKPKFDIDSKNFIRAIKKISPAIDSNNPKYELNGALIDIKESFINLVGTDTKRLSIIRLNTTSDENISIIIPKKAISEMQKLFNDEIEIFYDETTLIAKSDNFTFFTKLINGKFPDYDRIIPSEMNFRIQLPKDKMVDSIRQISIISNELKLTFKPEKIVFESLNDENIEAKTEIELVTGLNEEIVLGLNSRFILDFLSSVEEQNFSLGYNDSTLPFMLSSENFRTIIMPIII